MVTKNGSNEAWRDDTEGHCSTFITSLSSESAKKRLGGPVDTKAHGFGSFANIFNS